jgi:hypothetical protein
MSFFNSRGAGVSPGVIEGNALHGLSYRVAVCVERVLDSCMKQDTAEHTKLQLSRFDKADAKPPFKFISATSAQSTAVVTDLTITRLPERPDFARVKCLVTIPMRVTFEDADGKQCIAESETSIAEDVIMYVPKCSIFPFEVKAIASVNCPNGKPSGDNAFIVTACYTIITKITANTDLLIPTYGFCQIPRAVDFTQDECNDFFDLPLYPSGK